MDAKNPNPSANILINAAAARQIGTTPDGAIGQAILVKRAGAVHRMTIVGVVADANFDGMQTAVQPFTYYYAPDWVRLISVRIKPGQTREGVTAVDRIWHRFVPAQAIRRRFEDASFDKFFIDDERQGRIFGIFVGIAIFIACLGLFGLAAFTAERRTKEIGIRKVHGARTRDIVRLLLWQFSIPVLIANLIAWPVAYYLFARLAAGLCLSHHAQPALFPRGGADGAADRLGHRDRACRACGARQPHPRPAIRVKIGAGGRGLYGGVLSFRPGKPVLWC